MKRVLVVPILAAISSRAGAQWADAEFPLRSANIEGEVLAVFVLDTNGCADMKTFKVLKIAHTVVENNG